MVTRRALLISIVPALYGVTRIASAQPARLEEGDPVAVALGYKHDAGKVDTQKFPKYAPGQVCSNCQLYTGAAADAWGPCSAVGGRLVNAKGWCAVWVKKA